MTEKTPDETDSNDELPETFDGMPNAPMNPETIKRLQKHDAITACFPVYRRVDAPDEIVAVLIKTETSASLALYNPDRGAWERLFETEIYDSAYSDEALTAREKLDGHSTRVFEVYAKESVEFIKPGDSELFVPEENTFTSLLAGLPDKPVTKSLLAEFNQEPEVERVVPHVYLRDSRETLLFTVTIRDLFRDKSLFGIAMYDRDAEEWVASFKMDAERLNDDSDVEFEDAFDTAYEQVRDSYDDSDLGVLTDRADHDDWWIPDHT